MSPIENLKKYISEKFIIWHKPDALTWDEWTDWHITAKSSNPIGYWMHETLPDHFNTVKNYILDPIRNAKYWIRNRVFEKYHIIHTYLKPGYHDFDERCLHGMFNMLVDYVEKDLAWKSSIFDDELRKKRPWYSKGWLRFKNNRDPQVGLNHLKWESTLDGTISMTGAELQASRAREILDLYHWWKYVRPNRLDPMELSGWSQFCEEKRKKGIDILSDKGITAADKQKERECLNKTSEIENAFDDEDTTQLIRLIKIRKSLWV